MAISNEFILYLLMNDSLKSFLKANGYILTLSKNSIEIENLKKKKIEKATILDDDKERIRIKGETIAVSFNKDSNNDYYLDHLLIGDVKKNEFDFSYRNNLDRIIVKMIANNQKHIFLIKDNYLGIKKISMPNINSKKSDNLGINYIVEDFTLTENDNSKSENYLKECQNEFIILEYNYPTITSYINDNMPFISKCIDTCNDKPTKIYEVKRKRNR